VSVTWLRCLRILPTLALVALLAPSGCRHEVESPPVETTRVDPDLVCNAQLVTVVSITGDGFTPLPTEVLQDESVLVLPSVELLLAADLDGSEVRPTPEPVLLSGEPGGQNAYNLSWQSNRQMGASIDEPLALEPGIYDLTVTNPDGEQSADLPGAIAVVPPPVITELNPPALCNAQSDQTLELVGSYFLQAGEEVPTVTIASTDGDFSEQFTVGELDRCTDIPGRRQGTLYCESVTITIPAETLEPGDYEVTLTNPAPADCASTDTIILTVNPPPTVTDVHPQTVCSGGTILEIDGTDLQDGAAVDIVCDGETVASSTTTEVNEDGTQLIATVGGGVEVGEVCDVVVTNPDGCYDEPPHQQVTGVEGPILFYVDPPVVYTGFDTTVRLYLTTIEWPAEVTLAWVTDPDSGETEVLELGVPERFNNQDNRLEITIPAGLPGGPVEVRVNDETGCTAIRDDLLLVAEEQSLTLADPGGIDPPFGEESSSTAVTIYLEDGTFEPTPRVFLNRADGSGDAVALTGITYESPTRLTAVVPANTPAGTYRLVVVNPNGQVGVLDDAYESLSSPPPVITDVVPQSIVNRDGESIEVQGTGFSDSEISLDCVDEAGSAIGTNPTVASGSVDCSAGLCTQSATVDGSVLAEGSVCLVRVTNDDGSYGDFSAIGVTLPSYNLSNPRPAPNSMTQARRALSSAAVKATSAARYVYAIGGDGGSGTDPLDSVEFAPIGVYGEISPWVNSRTSPGEPRAFAGSATIDRYIYLFGGSDGTNALDSAERALVLSPEEVAVIEDIDLCLSGGALDCFGIADIGDGLPGGVYSYRVSAVIGDGDAENPAGETLASDPIVLELSEYEGRTISVELSWSAPLDSEGEVLSGISGYRIYRTPQDGGPGSEQRLAEVDADTLEYVDDGTESLADATPLPLGSTSGWEALPALSNARNGPAGAAARDPSDASRWYVYALLGKSSGAETGGTALDSDELLQVTLQPNGRQQVGSSWTTGTETSTVARWQHSAWVADDRVSTLLGSGETYVYLGGGLLGGNAENRDGTVEAALVGADGELGAFDASMPSFGTNRVGYGAAAAANRLFCFGGAAPGARANATAAEIIDPPPALDSQAWNNEGLTMTSERYLLGSSIQSAFIFLVGGEDASGQALDSMEMVVW
jgi:hypothetical protein